MKRKTEAVVGDMRLSLSPGSLEACIRALDEEPAFRVPPGSLEVAFVDEVGCRRLHSAFFGDPELTDVMTFPGDPEDGHAGDIAVCPAAAAACAGPGTPFREELTLYLVHAWLHLAGLRDDNESGRAGMRLAEAALMGSLRNKGAILEASWNPGPSRAG
ncbi:MAG: rRNA maturation RNase YbeY [Oceanipulchritudo sp.]